jgi:hypothetical protein
MPHKILSLKFRLSKVMATNINIIRHVPKYRGNTSFKKIKKYVSKNIRCNILIIGLIKKLHFIQIISLTII